MRKIIILFFLLTISTPTNASTAPELAREWVTILNYCKNVGFYKCQDRFEGSTRGLFHKPIELQKLRITEDKFDKFVKQTYGNELNASFLKLTASLKFNTTDKFDINQFTKNIKHIQPMNKEGTIYKFTFNNADPLALVIVNGTYKIGVFPEQEKEFKQSNSYTTARILRLKTNILRYHMKEAEILKYDRKTFERNISEAIAPIVYKLNKGNVPTYIQTFIKRDIGEVQRFYMPLSTDAAILNKIQEVNKL